MDIKVTSYGPSSRCHQRKNVVPLLHSRVGGLQDFSVSPSPFGLIWTYWDLIEAFWD